MWGEKVKDSNEDFLTKTFNNKNQATTIFKEVRNHHIAKLW